MQKLGMKFISKFMQKRIIRYYKEYIFWLGVGKAKYDSYTWVKKNLTKRMRLGKVILLDLCVGMWKLYKSKSLIMRQKNAKLCGLYAPKKKNSSNLCTLKIKIMQEHYKEWPRNQEFFRPFLVPRFFNWIVSHMTSYDGILWSHDLWS